MKFSEHWLRTFVNPALTTRELADALTMGGIEVEAIEPVAPTFKGVVVGEVLAVERHPDADRLTVCRVDAGTQTVEVVCGAPDVRAGIKVPLAPAGARLPAGEIKAAKVRGVASQGMLCSAQELGLDGEAGGLLLLPAGARPGDDLRQLLDLDDQLLTTKPTPNRGDCLSVLGMAREAAAVTGAALCTPVIEDVPPILADTLGITLDAPGACPLYCGRLVCGVRAGAATPRWMVERLARSGIRSISAIVDITNYVMLELGQPLHAFDRSALAGGICVRFAGAGECITLLNGETAALDSSSLVIADSRRALALAGIMGGADSGVGEATRDIFLEAAFFTPEVIAGKSRMLGFSSDSAYRFERGVDFTATRKALERATRLVLDICGGQPGVVSEARAALPERVPVDLSLERVQRVLGIAIDMERARDLLQRLGFACARDGGRLRVTPPGHRFDIAIEEDLIEELARLHGYDNIPATMPQGAAVMLPVSESRRSSHALRRLLVARDYQEVVTYSFVDRQWEADYCGNTTPVVLANPIASQMSVMRSSLIGSLVQCAVGNLNHRQTRVRLFEIGRCFAHAEDGGYRQPMRIGGIACGDALQEQWGMAARQVDFYDVKADVESLFGARALGFDAATHPALHPGRSARVVCGGVEVGWVGELHPRWQRKYDLRAAPVLFEVDFEQAAAAEVPAYNEISRFPPVRRDLAVIVDEGVAFQAMLEVLRLHQPAIVTDIGLFDVYRGGGVEKGKKSLAFRVLLQDTRKTLTDAEVDSAISQLFRIMQQEFDAKLR